MKADHSVPSATPLTTHATTPHDRTIPSPTNIYVHLFGPVIGDTLDRAQLVAEGQTNPTYESAVKVAVGNDTSLQMYPTAKGFVLKLMDGGKCTRQVQTGIMIASDGKPRCDLDSLAAGAKKLGFTVSGAKLFATYAEALGRMETVPTSMTRKSAEGVTAQFTVSGDMKQLSERIITIKIGDLKIHGVPDSREVRDAAAPFTEFVDYVYFLPEFVFFIKNIAKSIIQRKMKSTSPNDIEMDILKRNLSDDTIDQILNKVMEEIDVYKCEKCGSILSDDFTDHKICEECLYTYCLHCIHIMFSKVSCICVDCKDIFAQKKSAIIVPDEKSERDFIKSQTNKN